MKTFDPRMLFGFALLLLLTILAAVIALGKVEQQTSFGLQYILGALATLAGGFAQWAFANAKSLDDHRDKKDE